MTETGSRLEVTETGDGGFQIDAHRTDRYRIHVEGGLAARLGAHLKTLLGQLDAPRLVITIDTGAAEHHLGTITSAAGHAGVPFDIVAIPAGEATKSLAGLQAVWDELQNTAATRRTLLLAVGGGMVCDLTTTTAATYMRSVPYALVPTTVLAQVDAAIGGKGGIDHDGAKNLIGAFHHPAAVFIDPELTATLPVRHVNNGLAEVIKVALIADPALFTTLEDTAGEAAGGPHLTDIIRAAVRAKLRLLAPDPFEQRDLRRLLNLGHCIGHPYEAATGYRILHGEAVAAGLAAATALAHPSPSDDHDRILALLAAHRLPTTIPHPLRDAVWDGMQTVRRIRNGPLNLVLPHHPGHCTVTDDLDRDAFDRALKDLDTHPRGHR